jgi:hypothetical protein
LPENQGDAAARFARAATQSLEDSTMGKKHNTKVPDFSSHKAQVRLPKGAKDQAPPPLAAHPAPPPVPKAHAPKTSGHRGA